MLATRFPFSEDIFYFSFSCIFIQCYFFEALTLVYFWYSGELYCSPNGSCSIRGWTWGSCIICWASFGWPSKSSSSWGAKVYLCWRRLSVSSRFRGEWWGMHITSSSFLLFSRIYTVHAYTEDACCPRFWSSRRVVERQGCYDVDCTAGIWFVLLEA